MVYEALHTPTRCCSLLPAQPSPPSTSPNIRGAQPSPALPPAMCSYSRQSCRLALLQKDISANRITGGIQSDLCSKAHSRPGNSPERRLRCKFSHIYICILSEQMCSSPSACCGNTGSVSKTCCTPSPGAGRSPGAAPRRWAGARVALLACAFGSASPNAPATARLTNPADLTKFRKGKEQLLEKQVAQLAAAYINVVVVWGEIDEKTLTHADKYGIMVIQVNSRREMVYLSAVLGTPLMPYLLPPLEPGKCQRVYGQELVQGLAVVFEWECPGTPALTLVLRGATTEGLRGAEQAAYHGIDAYFQLCQDPRLLPGAGATEMALAKMLRERGTKLGGPSGPTFLAFAQALQSLPETLAENAGLGVSEVMAEMNGAHQAGNFLTGVGVEGIINVAQEEVWDILIAKAQGLQTVADVVLQLLTVDEIVVAKKSPSHQQGLNPNPKKAKEQASPVGKKSPWGQ
nr:T-complex protein 1 subunit theta-like 2 [Vicugna pacos]